MPVPVPVSCQRVWRLASPCLQLQEMRVPSITCSAGLLSQIGTVVLTWGAHGSVPPASRLETQSRGSSPTRCKLWMPAQKRLAAYVHGTWLETHVTPRLFEPLANILSAMTRSWFSSTFKTCLRRYSRQAGACNRRWSFGVGQATALSGVLSGAMWVAQLGRDRRSLKSLSRNSSRDVRRPMCYRANVHQGLPDNQPLVL